MRIIHYICEIKECISENKVVDIETIMYTVGYLLGWVVLFLLGYAGGSIIRGLLQGFGII